MANSVTELIVTDYKDPYDGVPDDFTDAIELALAKLPKGLTLDLCNGEKLTGRRGCILRFPARATRYRITRTIVLPADRSVALVGTGPFGVTIHFDPDPSSQFDPDANSVVWPGKPAGYAFLVAGAPGGSVLFERLTFLNGGLAFNGDTKWSGVRDCVFRGAPHWAISMLGGDVTGLDVDGCTVTGCANGFSLTTPHSGLRRVRRTRFDDNMGPDLRLGAGSHVSACTFTGKPEGFENQPFVEVVAPAQDIRIRDCSFGTAAGAPLTLISIGGPVGGSITFEPVRDVQLVACQLWIREPDSEGLTNKPCAVRLCAPVIGVQIRGCSVWSGGLVVAEDFFAAELLVLDTVPSFMIPWGESAHLTFDNVVSNIAIFPPALPTLFSHGGRGFEVAGLSGTRAAGRGDDQFRGTRNMLRHAAANVDPGDGAWVRKGSLKPIVSIGDPKSPVGISYEAERSGPGAAWVEQVVPFEDWKAPPEGPLVFSCWIRGTEGSGFRMEISVGWLAVGGSSVHALRLSNTWQRFFVVAHRLPKLPVGVEALVRAKIHVGETDQDASASIFFCGAQLEAGDRPTVLTAGWPLEGAASSTGGAVLHHGRAAQDLSVGPLTIGTATTAPKDTDGFNLGDALLNAKPKVSGDDVDGWVCVDVGTGDTVQKAWRGFGPLGPTAVLV